VTKWDGVPDLQGGRYALSVLAQINGRRRELLVRAGRRSITLPPPCMASARSTRSMDHGMSIGAGLAPLSSTASLPVSSSASQREITTAATPLPITKSSIEHVEVLDRAPSVEQHDGLVRCDTAAGDKTLERGECRAPFWRGADAFPRSQLPHARHHRPIGDR